MYLVRKYNPFKRASAAAAAAADSPEADPGSAAPEVPAPQQHAGCIPSSSGKRKTAERELQLLNVKIDKLLADIEEEQEREVSYTKNEECVACLSSRATMQTLPCGHRVVCRRCFVRTIQTAVKQRSLPLRCVVCRAKILKLKHVTTTTSTSTSTTSTSTAQPPPGTTTTTRRHPPRASSLGRVPPNRGPNAPRAQFFASPTPSSSSRFPGGSSAAAACGFSPPVVPRPAPATKIMQPLLIYPSAGGGGGGLSGLVAASPHPRLQVKRALAWSSSGTVGACAGAATDDPRRDPGGDSWSPRSTRRCRRQTPSAPGLTEGSSNHNHRQRTRAHSEHRK